VNIGSPRRTLRLRQRLREATHASLLDAAEQVFAAKGVQGSRMEDVAAAAGVAVGTLYNYFADRSALLEALLDARADELLSGVDAALAERGAPFDARLTHFLVTTFEYFERHLGMFAVYMEAEHLRRAGARRRQPTLSRLLDRTTKLVDEGVESGALRKQDAAVYPTLLIGMLRGAFLRHIYGLGDAPAPDTAERIVRVFLRGAAERAVTAPKRAKTSTRANKVRR